MNPLSFLWLTTVLVIVMSVTMAHAEETRGLRRLDHAARRLDKSGKGDKGGKGKDSDSPDSRDSDSKDKVSSKEKKKKDAEKVKDSGKKDKGKKVAPVAPPVTVVDSAGPSVTIEPSVSQAPTVNSNEPSLTHEPSVNSGEPTLTQQPSLSFAPTPLP